MDFDDLRSGILNCLFHDLPELPETTDVSQLLASQAVGLAKHQSEANELCRTANHGEDDVSSGHGTSVALTSATACGCVSSSSP
jgi:hypothetical protein